MGLRRMSVAGVELAPKKYRRKGIRFLSQLTPEEQEKWKSR
jgi:hypothetical protein